MSTFPEVGQTVMVRGMPFIVESSQVSGLSDQHLVKLSCLEENDLGAPLQVIWELEPGAKILESSSLPSLRQFDDPGDLDAFISATRWGIISQTDANSMQSPFRSGVEAEDYQLEPVAKALTMPRVNLLLADDVGLGKTIEAGLTMQELILRGRVNTVLIICPASLQYQWRDEMRDKFGLEFRIVNKETLSSLRRQRGIHVNPWTHFPRLITSIDYFKQEYVFRRFRETLPSNSGYPRAYDLLIVDEAHNIAPAGSLHYAKPSLRTNVIRQIAPHFENRMFLTATPHNGYTDSFSALLEILDDQCFLRGVQPSPETLGQVMVRRMKSEIKNVDDTPRFPERKVQPLEVEYDEEERNAHKLLSKYAVLCKSRAGFGQQAYAVHFVMKLLKKRLFSSPLAFLNTLEKHIEKREKRDWANSGGLPDQYNLTDLPDLEDAQDEEADELMEAALNQCANVMAEPAADEKELLAKLRSWAQKAAKRQDSKIKRLLQWLDENLRSNGDWTDERVVIFTEYVDSQTYIKNFLPAELRGDKLICMNGFVSPQDREKHKAAFQAHPATSPVRILLGTDAASEGINLQNHCSNLIHYEIPWNPSRMEQRNGRIDRHGQKAACVNIYLFVAANYVNVKEDGLTADLEFLYRAARKVENIRQDLGKVGPVIAAQVEKAMLSEAKRQLDTSRAEQDAAAARKLLKIDRDLKSILEANRKQLENTRRDLLLTPERIRHAVDVALRLAAQPALEPVQADGIAENHAFHLPPFSGAWAACLEGNSHPFTGEWRPVVFNADEAANRDDVVLAHLNSRLVTMCLRFLRSQLWAAGPSCQLHRAACRCLPSSVIYDPVVMAFGRIIVTGGTNQRIFEEMIMAGGRIRKQRFSRMGNVELKNFYNSTLNMPFVRCPAVMESRLADNVWPKVKEALVQALNARCKERLDKLSNRLSRQAQAEVRRFSAIMDEMKAMLNKHLAEMQTARQLTFFDNEETAAFRADESVLHNRLKRIDKEKEDECRHLMARFENPQTTLFPLAVLWFVPESMCRGA